MNGRMLPTAAKYNVLWDASEHLQQLMVARLAGVPDNAPPATLASLRAALRRLVQRQHAAIDDLRDPAEEETKQVPMPVEADSELHNQLALEQNLGDAMLQVLTGQMNAELHVVVMSQAPVLQYALASLGESWAATDHVHRFHITFRVAAVLLPAHPLWPELRLSCNQRVAMLERHNQFGWGKGELTMQGLLFNETRLSSLFLMLEQGKIQPPKPRVPVSVDAYNARLRGPLSELFKRLTPTLSFMLHEGGAWVPVCPATQQPEPAKRYPHNRTVFADTGGVNWFPRPSGARTFQFCVANWRTEFAFLMTVRRSFTGIFVDGVPFHFQNSLSFPFQYWPLISLL
jgi:hypothetical protein